MSACRPESHLSPAAFSVALEAKGVLMIPFVEGTVRAVTHVDVTEEDVQTALEKVRELLKKTAESGHKAIDITVKSPYGEW